MFGTIELIPRLLGGGGDGGSTGAESRSCYLEMYSGRKPDKVNPEEERLARWTTCLLTGMPLQPPCVCDELGSLYNKDAVIHALVGKTIPKGLSHISSLKHVFDIHLERSADKAGGKEAVQFSCPISGQPLNGKYKFKVVRSSGHVLSERALKEVPQAVEELVGKKVSPSDLLTVNPPPEEYSQLREALLEQRAAARAAKKEGKKAAAGAKRAAGEATAKQNGSQAAPTAGAAPAAAQAAAAAGLYAAELARSGGVVGAKKFKASELMPSNADKKVWESLFRSSRGAEEKETYLCRSTAARGMHLS